MEDILIICGTNRNEAVSYQVSRIYQELLKQKNIKSEIINLGDLPPDFAFSALYEKAGTNTEFNHFKDLMNNYTKYVFVVPEYNGSFPGVLKTFIDGMDYPSTFKDKKCGVIGVSSGPQGAGMALSHLTDIFNYCGMYVLPQKPRLALINKHLQEGSIINELYITLINEQADKLIAF